MSRVGISLLLAELLESVAAHWEWWWEDRDLLDAVVKLPEAIWARVLTHYDGPLWDAEAASPGLVAWIVRRRGDARRAA